MAELATAGRPGRIRLSKALAATAKAMAKAAGASKPTQRISRHCKLAPHEEAQLAALKQRVQKLGLDTKKGDLLRAGLLLLASCDDLQLQKAVARLDAVATPAAGEKR
ncbi:MAG: hypothetical protein NDI67_11300 [Sulfuritalea sp.]|nr:hypothetical protein [Sulfuritalea sp.]